MPKSIKQIISSNLFKLTISLVVCFGVAFLGSWVTIPSTATWYSALHKPFFSPPNWVFGPVWSTLYFMMGVAAFLVWKTGWTKKTQGALRLFILQLGCNLIWSIVFFGLHSPMLGLLTIGILGLLIVLTLLSFRRISRWAAWLLVPYLCWVSFAALLNLAIVVLN